MLAVKKQNPGVDIRGKKLTTGYNIKTMKHFFILLIMLSCVSCREKPAYREIPTVDVLIIGGGASGTAAGIQSARLGANTLIIEEFEWLGGALTSAGVSAIDGNYKLPSGLFGEFRRKLVEHYGNENEMRTGWVASQSAEPSVMNKVFKKMVAAESLLDVWYYSTVKHITQEDDRWIVEIDRQGVRYTIKAQILIDGTELGDVAKMCNVGYDIGMEDRVITGESIAPEKSNHIIQDLTYVAIVKEYDYDVTIPEPEGYDPSVFYCSCKTPACTNPVKGAVLWECDQMLSYGKLPNKKYMLNWPIAGNDFYLNLIEQTPKQRREALKAAKNHTLCYLYYLQTALGFNTIGLADDEYPTDDLLPFISYHRESRRIHGLVRFNLNHVADPFHQPEKLYRTNIAVGDYPVDHHHGKYEGSEVLPDVHFYPVPSFGLPLGTLLPEDVENLIVTEKSISVSNIVNGATRLQPVLVQIGQAAGVVAGLAVRDNLFTSEVPVRDVQQVLLEANGYLLPYLDLPPGDEHFKALQRIGSTGILRGRGLNVGWSNQTWFDADSTLQAEVLQIGLSDFYPTFSFDKSGDLTIEDAFLLIYALKQFVDRSMEHVAEKDFIAAQVSQWPVWGFTNFNLQRKITRKEFAVILDALVDPFNAKSIDIKGDIIDE